MCSYKHRLTDADRVGLAAHRLYVGNVRQASLSRFANPAQFSAQSASVEPDSGALP
jgi:hypothetical protein